MISRRFGLRQPGKIRLIDDLSGSLIMIKKTVQCAESPKPHSVDFIAALLVKALEVSRGKSIKGRTFDLKSAYKQLAVSQQSLEFAFVAVYNPTTGKAEIFQMLAAPFGATRSVYSFLRISHAIWFTGVKALKLAWSCFFDDYVVFSCDEMVKNTQTTVELLFQLLGWKFAMEGDKANAFDETFSALGICVELDESSNGRIKFSNTSKRASELKETIAELLTKGSMSVLEAQKLRGRMQFAEGQIFGRLGKLCLRAVTQHAFPYNGGRITAATMDATRRYSVFLDYPEPRSLELAYCNVWSIYTDACYEPTREGWQCGLGGVLVDHQGRKLEFFSAQLDREHMHKLGALQKRTIIFEAELLAMVLALFLWRMSLKSVSLVCFVDNNSARDVAISGSARNATANCLIDFLVKLEMASIVYVPGIHVCLHHRT